MARLATFIIRCILRLEFCREIVDIGGPPIAALSQPPLVRLIYAEHFDINGEEIVDRRLGFPSAILERLLPCGRRLRRVNEVPPILDE